MPVISQVSLLVALLKEAKLFKRHNHKNTDDDGTFSCFGRFCGLECSIVCGGPPRRKKTRQGIRSHSMDNLRSSLRSRFRLTKWKRVGNKRGVGLI
ncbi:hypothetical protein NC653_024117 [Populus alba x Populus x berolinensis]|uniref:Uncharacterized protein n=1 Tax=Populus alba x Populus x berolinensis TaxID=444605 RepID=A0AAD6M867_9ROSI|nr:hypothetical protein NC653_024117 [Populus alba x Populus x berolinensis]